MIKIYIRVQRTTSYKATTKAHKICDFSMLGWFGIIEHNLDQKWAWVSRGHSGCPAPRVRKPLKIFLIVSLYFYCVHRQASNLSKCPNKSVNIHCEPIKLLCKLMSNNLDYKGLRSLTITVALAISRFDNERGNLTQLTIMSDQFKTWQ